MTLENFLTSPDTIMRQIMAEIDKGSVKGDLNSKLDECACLYSAVLALHNAQPSSDQDPTFQANMENKFGSIRYLQGRVMELAGNVDAQDYYSAAAQHFERAIEHCPDSAAAHLNLAQADSKRGLHEYATNSYEEALRIVGKIIDTPYKEAVVNKALNGLGYPTPDSPLQKAA